MTAADHTYSSLISSEDTLSQAGLYEAQVTELIVNWRKVAPICGMDVAVVMDVPIAAQTISE